MGSQDTDQPIVFVCLPHRDHSAFALVPEPNFPAPEPWEEELVTGTCWH